MIGLITIGLIVSHRGTNDFSRIYYVIPVYRLPEFVFGICGYILFVERGLMRGALARAGVVFGVGLLLCVYWRGLPGSIDWGVFASIAFMAIFVFCLSWDASSIVKRVFNYMGRISYCVYMAQFTTIPILKRFEHSLSHEQKWAVLITSTIVLAVFTYHFVEVLAYSRCRKMTVRVCRWATGCLSGRKVA